ncbi:MAG TPA: phosphoadenylyl-sulfate reductase [Salinivirgaceae bacterium]|nr:phosphoadenylyl-sulfate reductase [Salinivirgaceae bacterium]
MIAKNKINNLNKQFLNLTIEERIIEAHKIFGDKLIFASSLGAEDQIITHYIATNCLEVRIITLDTGRLFPETYKLMDATRKQYNKTIEVVFPDYQNVEAMVNKHGVNLFYESVELRKLCCKVRKIEPLKRVLNDYDAWITGLRREQSITRTNTQLVEWDETFGLIKINPLLDLTERDMWGLIAMHTIPYNSLHDKNFPSIGCQPCTRAVNPGEDIRSGRWWWEKPEHKECGLHLKDTPDSKQ